MEDVIHERKQLVTQDGVSVIKIERQIWYERRGNRTKLFEGYVAISRIYDLPEGIYILRRESMPYRDGRGVRFSGNCLLEADIKPYLACSVTERIIASLKEPKSYLWVSV